MKLYWRYKKNGKWTWTAAGIRGVEDKWILVWNEIPSEEE